MGWSSARIERNKWYTGMVNRAYTSDLKRFLVPLPVEQTLPLAFNVVVNWASGTKAK